MRRWVCTAASLLSLIAAGPAPGQSPAPDGCSAFAWTVLDAKAAMGGALPAIASGSAAPADFTLALIATDAVAFPVKPERAPKKPGTFGGYVIVEPPKGGSIQVTLSDDAWVDVVQGGALVKASAFSGKSGCDGVRKSIRFALAGNGPVTLQLSGADRPSIKVDVRAVD